MKDSACYNYIIDRRLANIVKYLRQTMPAEFEPGGPPSRPDREIYVLSPEGSIWDIERDDQNQTEPWLSDAARDELGRDILERLPRARAEVSRLGIHALAWYSGFHDNDERWWGIYITVEGIAYIAGELLASADGHVEDNGLSREYRDMDGPHLNLVHKLLKKRAEVQLSEEGTVSPDLVAKLHAIDAEWDHRKPKQNRDSHHAPSMSLELALQLAVLALLRHEEFHHQVEVFATGLELQLARPIYHPYKNNVYKPLMDTVQQREEGLAQRRVVRHRWKQLGGPCTRITMEAVADNSPVAYREWRHYVGERAFAGAVDILASEILHGVPNISPSPLSKYFPSARLPPPVWRSQRIPVYLVGDDIPAVWGDVFFANLTYRDLRRWLLAQRPTWYVPLEPSTHKGVDAKIWPSGTEGDGYGVPIKVHNGTRAVSISTLKDVAKQLGIPAYSIGR